MTQALYRLHAHTAAAMIRDGKLKPSTLMQAFVDRVAELEPTVGAFEAINTEAALKKQSHSISRHQKAYCLVCPLASKT